jgi:hypothetical protein
MKRILVLVLFGCLVSAPARAQSIDPAPPPPNHAPASDALITDAPPDGGASTDSSTYSPAYSATDPAGYPGAGLVETPCPAAAADCPNRCTITVDSLWLDRNYNSHNFLGQTVAAPFGAPVNTLYPSGAVLHPGARLQLTYLLTDELAIEAIYFGLQQWTSSNSITADPLLGIVAISPYTQSDKLLGGFDQSLGYSYSSRLNNGEINFRAPVAQRGRWTRDNLLGVRYIQFNESFNLNGQDAFFNVAENINTHTSNSMLGTQVGTALRTNWDKWQLNMTGKAGLFTNFISQRVSNLNSTGVTAGFPPGFIPISTGRTSTDVAGVLDFSAIATYRINNNFALRGGYQLLYLAGVALGSQQMAGFSHGGDVFLHGPSAGLELSH